MTFANMSAQSIDRLWKSYDEAIRDDRPKTAMTVLEQIKAGASEQRLAWDYYQACSRYVECGRRINWKDAEKLEKALEKELEEYDEPVLTFYHMKRTARYGQLNHIKEHEERLKAGKHTEFYGNDYSFTGYVFSSILLQTVQNDYEYALWSCLESGEKTAAGMLEVFYSGSYPKAALLEFSQCDLHDVNALKEYAARYKGKASSLLAKQNLLQIKYNELLKKKNQDQEDYIRLRKECKDFLSEKAGFSSSEKAVAGCATMVESLLEQLDEKSFSFNVRRGVMEVSFKNLDKVKYSFTKDKEKDITKFLTKDKVKEDEKLPSGVITNSTRRFFLEDMEKLSVKDLDDGDYLIELSAGLKKEKQCYTKYSISIAVKRDVNGHAVFAADTWTGRPVDKCDFFLFDSDGKLISEARAVKLHGFTYLPEEMEKAIKVWDSKLICSFRDEKDRLHISRMHRFNEYLYPQDATPDIWSAVIIPDRAAFHPGESVHFKSVIYHGDPKDALQTAEEGTEVTVSLCDPKGKLVEEQTLKTNSFGSVAGQFTLPADRSKGLYLIKVSRKNRELESVSVQVDEYVLPSFTLSFDRQEKFYLPGDAVCFSGTLKSYSGHSLSGADIRYYVSIDGDKLSEGELELDSDGGFKVTTPESAMKDLYWYSYANIRITVTDATGETLEWQNSTPVRRDIPLRTAILNQNEGKVMPIREEAFTDATKIVSEDKVVMYFDCLRHKSLSIVYTLWQGKVIIAKGKAEAGEKTEIDLSGKPSGLYHIDVEAEAKDANGNKIERKERSQIVKISENDTQFNVQSESIISLVKSENIAIQFGAGLQDIWACVELAGMSGKAYKSELVHIRKGEMKTITYAFDPGYSNSLLLKVIYFSDGECQQWSREFTNKAKTLKLPLSFSRFTDKSGPRKLSTFEISTLADVECAVSVFDKSTDAVKANLWREVALQPSTPVLNYTVCLGMDYSSYNEVTTGYGRSGKLGRPVIMSKSAAVTEDMVFEEDSAPMAMANADVMTETSQVLGMNAEQEQEAQVREDFAGTICFQPFLRSDAEGRLRFEVTAGDKLSTFYVYVYGHDREMKNATLKGEMLVSIPVKLSLTEPQHLCTGDRYVVKANLSSNLKTECTGTMTFSIYDGKDYKETKALATKQSHVTIPAGGTAPVDFEISVPDVKELGVLLKFTSVSGSDAVFVSIPVSPARQTLIEAHSAVMHPGESETALEESLRAMFVNVQGEEAGMRLTSLLGMVRNALPELIEPKGKDALSLSESLYARLLSEKIGKSDHAEVAETEKSAEERAGKSGTVTEVNAAPTEEAADSSSSNSQIMEKLLKCQNKDGGFGWFEGMSSSGIISAQILKMVGSAQERGLKMLPEENIKKAVRYLDRTYFSEENSCYWHCRVSMDQYAFIRSMFPQIEFSTEELDKKLYCTFRKELPKYLVPRKARGLNSYILSKARRLRTLMLLGGSEEGLKLAKAFGIRFFTSRRISKSINADLSSLLEYAVEHKSGGMYYPNAVMPFRGLLESELEAHSMLCDLLRDSKKAGLLADEKVSDGIRLWLMIQKETQQWEKEPAYVEAIASVLDGSDYILQTKVMSLTKNYTVPFEVIQKSSNGMSVSRSFRLIESDGSMKEIAEGDILKVGDKVEARYSIWSEENRSFVHLNVGRPASFRPVNQLSGRYGWWLAPLRIDDFYTITPQGYREVGISGSEYWFDVYPEEKTTLTELFFVTQEGSFQMPVAEIECLYAPHYRGNDGCHHNPMVSQGR